MEFVLEAKKPFQFLANLINIYNMDDIVLTIPMTQDASSSAYKITSYLLMNKNLAKKKELI